MNYYKKHLGDYAKKTGHLSPLEHGVYGLIMDAYYDREQGPTLVEATRWARARTEDEKSAVLAVLDEFFTLGEDGRYSQKRIEEELCAYRAQAEANRAVAVERERRKRERREHGDSTNRAQVVHDNDQNREPSHKPIAISHKPIEETTSEQSQSVLTDEEAAEPAEKPRKHHGSEEDHKAARWMFDLVRKVNATAKEPNWPTWANDVRLMREIDGRTHKEICELFGWAKKDAFWCSNIQSPSKLREKWDTLVERRAQPARSGAATISDQKFRPNASDYSSSNAAMARSMEQHGIKPGDLLDGNEIDF